MEQRLIKGNGGSQLTLFFHGWGMSDEVLPFTSVTDMLVIYNYTSLAFDNTLLEQYESFNLIAWSMGVWAAEQIELPSLTHALAINGTSHPVSDTEGIPTTIFSNTLASLNEDGLKRFYRRMCGDSDRLRRFTPSSRTIQSLKEELHAIGEKSTTTSPSPKQWNKAIIGERDMIFPYNNQLNHWKELATITDAPHYIW